MASPHSDQQVIGVAMHHTRPSNFDNVALPILATSTLPRSVLENLGWQPLPLTYKLGIPLKTAVFAEIIEVPILPIPPSAKYNEALLAFSLFCDPKAKEFGFSRTAADGSAALMRADGRDLGGLEIHPLFVFVMEELKDIRMYGGARLDRTMPAAELEEKKLAAQLCAEKLTPKYYSDWFDAYMARRKEAGEDMLEGITCAAQMGCIVCGKQEDGGFAKLKCGKCKAVGYCGAECQKADWKAHKKVCIPYDQGVVEYGPLRDRILRLDGLPRL